MLTKASVVPGTVPDLERLGIDVQILAVLVVTLAKPLKEVANRHFRHLILVQELALVSLLAQVSHPVLADHRPLAAHVAEWTVAPARARSVQVELAQGGLVL